MRNTNSNRNLFGESRRYGVAIEPPSFASHVEGGINRLLNIAASFFQDLSHFARHVARIVLFPLRENLRAAVDDLSAARSRREPPPVESLGRSLNCLVYVFFV